MLYIIGGAARSGKSLLSRRLSKEKGVSHFPVDVLVSGLEAMPGIDIVHDMDFLQKAEVVAPCLIAMLEHLAAEKESHVVEGDGLLPSVAGSVIAKYPDYVRTCFLGFPNQDAQEKLSLVREHDGADDDWTSRHSDEVLLGYIQRMIDWSRDLKSMCETMDIAFIDVGDDFLGAQEEAFQVLTQNK